MEEADQHLLVLKAESLVAQSCHPPSLSASQGDRVLNFPFHGLGSA